MTTTMFDAPPVPTQEATLTLLSSSQARVSVHEARGRLILSLWCRAYDTRRMLVEDLRKTFPGHQDRCWRKAEGVWSFPLKHRAKLLAWVVCWFEPEAIDWAVLHGTTKEEEGA